MEFRKAAKEELETVHALYRRVAGRDFCVWDEDYPGWQEIREDFEAGTLYVMVQEETLLGAVSIIVRNELDELPFWRCRAARELARVVVAPEHRGEGIAVKMVTEVSGLLRSQGVPAIHLLAAQANPPAQQVYRRCGFRQMGQAFLFGHDYLAFELLL